MLSPPPKQPFPLRLAAKAVTTTLTVMPFFSSPLLPPTRWRPLSFRHLFSLVGQRENCVATCRGREPFFSLFFFFPPRYCTPADRLTTARRKEAKRQENGLLPSSFLSNLSN